MAQAVPARPSFVRPAINVGIAAALLAVAAGTFVVFRGSSDAPGTPAPSAVSTGGVITYEVTGAGLFLADGSGASLGTTTYEHLHPEGHVATAQDRVASPDGALVAQVRRDELTGVFLTVSSAAGAEKFILQLASGSDPALVDGGKGAARAVEGIPLVVAWSPDSKTLAFGSVTGEPYTLGIVSNMDYSSPYLRYADVRGGYVGELAWSPDGEMLAISTYSLDRLNHTVLLADPTTGYVRTLIDGCHITWSPDSKYVAVHRDPGVEGGAWVVSVTDAAERWAISNEEKAFPLTWTES